MARILIVDDEQEVLSMLEMFMRNAGHEVLSATDGEQAIVTAQEQRPDVVLLDVNLPKKDGFEVCAALRSDERTRDVAIIMLTAAYDTIQDAQRGLRIGADEYVVKPFLRDVLLHNVERLIKAKKEREEAMPTA